MEDQGQDRAGIADVTLRRQPAGRLCSAPICPNTTMHATKDPERILLAERGIAYVRAAVIGFNIAFYYLVLDLPGDRPVLAAAVSIVAAGYSIVTLMEGPRRLLSLYHISLATAAADAVLIGLWLWATGGGSSPFHPLWYLDMVAVAFRFGAATTALVTALFMTTDFLIFSLDGTFLAAPGPSTVAIVYIGLVGAMATIVTSFLSRQSDARTQLQSTADLLEKEVAARTADLHTSQRELARSLADLQSAHTELQKLDKMKTRLLNTTSHELNTPLTPVMMQLHLMASGALGELTSKQTQSLAMIQRNVQRLRRLIDDMIEVARIESGEIRLEVVPTDLRVAVQSAVDAVAETAEAAGAMFRLEVPASLAIEADPNRLTHVLVQLLDNAIKFSPAGQTIEVSLMQQGDEAHVSVTDHGAGLMPGQIHEMFRPFTRFPESDMQDAGGTGIGLFLAKGIIEAHGGTIHASSQGRGLGTTMHVVLPVKRNPLPANPRASAPGEVGRQRSPGMKT